MCGMTASDFDAAMTKGGETTTSMDEALRVLVSEGASAPTGVLKASIDRGDGEVPEEGETGARRCWSCRLVRNPTLLLVRFDDGTEGRIRKKREFQPREGMLLEAEPSEEEGFCVLVGRYRDNGERLG